MIFEMSDMKIVADADIPFLRGVFEPYAEVVYEKGNAIGPRTVRDADALIIRTRTRCDAALLEGSRVRLIASATIGKDHVDLEYCRRHGICFLNAAGCNAGGVMQYVYTALFALAQKNGLRLRFGDHPAGSGAQCGNIRSGEIPAGEGARKKEAETAVRVIGVIGVGHVGSKVADLGEYLGFEVLRNDPPKEREQEEALRKGIISPEKAVRYCTLEELLRRSDAVTMHVPLEASTVSLADGHFFSRMKEGAVFINTSRGEVVDEAALMQARGRLSGLILDVWGGEPQIDRRLLALADIATPHIAGYSYEGKLNGTTLTVRGTAGFFNIEPLKAFTAPADTPNPNHLDLKGAEQAEICDVLTGIFPIFELDRQLRDRPQDFEQIRSNYKYRREFYVNTVRHDSIGAERDFGRIP